MDQRVPWRSMRTTLAGFWRGRDVGIVYGVIVIIASTWIGLHSDLTVRRLVEDVSTNLDNMRSHPVAVLAASAFVVSPLTQLLLVPVVVVVFGIVQRWLGRTALIAIWAFGHVGATLFVMAMEINALYRDLAHFSIVAKPDVGVSYGMAAAIGLLCAHLTPRWRLPYGLGCLVVTGAMLAIWPTFTSLGHLTAIVIGLGMAAAVHGAERASARPWSAAPSAAGRSLGA
ncbi:MAG TPA: rhomboid-like protein [Microlunatus sp.]|nr:rhomboid-like protein [Microlunatus sp.]